MKNTKAAILSKENSDKTTKDVNTLIQDFYDWSYASDKIKDLNWLLYLASQSPEWAKMKQADQADILFTVSHIGEFIAELQEKFFDVNNPSREVNAEPEKKLKKAA